MMGTMKSTKEHFVSGLNGTTFVDVNLIIHYPIVLCVIRAFLLAMLPHVVIRSPNLRFLVDYLLLVVPMVGITTVVADYVPAIFTGTLATWILMLMLLPSKSKEKIANKDSGFPHAVTLKRSAAEELLNDGFELSAEESQRIDNRNGNEDSSPLTSFILVPNRVPGITSCRSWITLISCICILAVDFHIFPRRLAKTEVFGTGLMDTGVGLFVMSNAIVSPESRGKSCHSRNFFDKLSHAKESIIMTWPLWVLGLLRALTIKLIGYQEHVSEYGVYWNFFFTLAAVRILSSFLLTFTSVSCSLFFSICCIIVYQFMLSHPAHNLTALILNNERSGFVLANKEGIFSCFGYLSLYLAVVHFGSYLFERRNPNIISWALVSLRLIFLSVLLWLFTFAANDLLQPVSRRFANLAYVTWILSMSCSLGGFMMAAILILSLCSHNGKLPTEFVAECYLLMERKNSNDGKTKYAPPPPNKCLLDAINRNQFFYFIISNLITGFVNVCLDTLHVSDSVAVLVMLGYTFSSLAIVWVLHMRESSLKFW